jgi:flagellar assembly protein FliH
MEKKILSPESDAPIDVKPFEMAELTPSKGVFRTPTLESKRLKPTLPPSPVGAGHKPVFQVDEAVSDLIVDEVEDSREEEIESRVAERIASIREAAEREASERGYTEGLKKGETEARSELEGVIRDKGEVLDSAISSLESLKGDVYRANERFLLETVMRVSTIVLQKEIESDPEYVSRLIRSAVERVGTKEQLKVIVNASRLEAVYSMLPELEKRYSSLKNISIEASPQLNENDVVLETDWNRIDATLDSQIESLRDLILSESQSDSQSESGEGTAE